MRKRLLIAIGVIFLLIFGYVVFSIIRYINVKDKTECEYYCRAAGIPSFAGCVEDNEIVGGNVFLQTRKFRSVEEMCANLPAGFTEAVNKALSSGKHEKAADIKNIPVTLYEVDPKLLPLREKESTHNFECRYCVMEYSDNTYGFVLITDIAFTR